SRKTLMRLCATCIVTSLVMRCFAYFLWNVTAAYVLTPFRMDELAMGALVALYARGPGGIAAMVRPAKWIVGILGVSLAVIWYQEMEDVNYTVALTTLSAFFGALLVVAVGGKLGSMVFSIPVLRFFGKYSYGIYVFHWMLAPMLEKYFSHVKMAAMSGSSCVGVVLSLGMAVTISSLSAVMSWGVCEKQFLI